MAICILLVWISVNEGWWLLNILTSVYWDLFRIYDTHSRYTERQAATAQKLAEFGRSTAIFPDIVRKALSFKNKSKNPQNVEAFLTAANAKSSRCFIATAAFDSSNCLEVQTLCLFRDQFLTQKSWGRHFIVFYYRHSPPVAEWLDQNSWAKRPLRFVLRHIATFVSMSFRLNSQTKS